jgi:hypothetical protein
MKSVNIVALMARMFEQYLKVINSETIAIGGALVDTLTEVIQGPCKENQTSLVDSKILDSSREFMSAFDNKSAVAHLGFVPPETDDDDDLLDELDGFVSNIATMLTSLIEGPEDMYILKKMHFSLQISDLKKRMFNVFGIFLISLDLYPRYALLEGEEPETVQMSVVSARNHHNILSDLSTNKINNRVTKDSYDSNVAEAFEIYKLLQALGDAIPSAKLSKSTFSLDEWKVYEFLG